jgi:hypothetical protein
MSHRPHWLTPRFLFGTIAVLAGVWALALSAGYGQSVTLGPWRISSRDPRRPLLVFAIAGAAYALASGLPGLRRDVSRLGARASVIVRLTAHAFERMEARVSPVPIVLMIAVGSAVTALRFNATTAGGSDAFSYVTQADLWLRGPPRMRIDMPIASRAPWPDAIGTFTPFGYRAAPDRRAIVPVTAPGLPLMMAAFKAIAGHCAMFWVVPLSGALLVCATFMIGRRLGSDAVGVAAAWLVATSPTVLVMSKSVMSDAPAAAFWALAISLILCRSTAALFGAGLSTSAAIMIRPNLLPVGLVLGLWAIWREIRAGSDARTGRVLAFAAGAIPGCIAVAAINRWLYGSPLTSGYGDLDRLFSLGNVAVNVRQYASWLAGTQTPLAIAGAAALLVPSRRLWPTPGARDGARWLAVVALAVFGVYSAYTPFDAWWYLRFLLPAWPALFIGTAALLVGLARGRAVWFRALTVLAVLALGVHAVATARRLGVYPPGEGERRYATIAGLVAQVTDASSAIITTAHAGPVRYYGGRLTVRYDVLDGAWLDRAVEWLAREGRRPYILLEEDEVPDFRRRFRGARAVAALEGTPVLIYEAHQIAGRVYLFDPVFPASQTWHPPPIRDPQPRCVHGSLVSNHSSRILESSNRPQD